MTDRLPPHASDVMVGDITYRIHTVRVGSEWRAFATRDGERYGIEALSGIEAEAVERLTHWLKWQQAHGEALATLQQAEQTYHRALAHHAFGEQGASRSESDQLLAMVDAARANLDAWRARRPNI